jgi:hypothetical protein
VGWRGTVYLDKATTGRLLTLVRGGKTVTPQLVRDLVSIAEHQKVQMGVLDNHRPADARRC